MRYYSDVALSMRDSDIQELIRQAKEQDEYICNFVTKQGEYVRYSNEYSSLIWEYVKWYEGYEYVNFILDFIRAEDRNYTLKRIGEEYTDIEVENNNGYWSMDECVDIVRSLEAHQVAETVKGDPRILTLENMCFECETKDCAFNAKGICRYAMVYEKKPETTKKGDCVVCIPPADVVPVVHSRWVKSGNVTKCLNCGNPALYTISGRLNLTMHCDLCGAKMDLGEPER